ncbi:MAG: dicarboxylate/amino acid:cation symporter [Verrucomicrobiia bacterium]|jgi:proton glutamate symport protein|tara:strand:+ start:2065 stop:3360 length:1296 start_codon:yes stop_codon:yes gene_type:complete
MAWYKQLHWQIILGLLLGTLYGIAAANWGWGGFTANWVAPFGKIFINLLKLIAMPLVLASLVCGVASLSDFKKLSRMGGKTIGLYLATTAVAVTIGLLVVNTINPGKKLPEETRLQLQEQYKSDVAKRSDVAAETQKRGPLQPLVDMVPSNFLEASGNNRAMLQVVFASLLFGAALVLVEERKRKPIYDVFAGLQEVVIKVVHLIMLMAPIGVFALIADTINTMAKDDPSQIISLLGSLGWYCAAVIIGLALHAGIVYLGLIKLLTPLSIKQFFKGIGQAQLLAFSTSSSGATLPVTMKCAEENLGASKEVSSFVLPLGATINMDGTALYQAVAAVFIAQASGIELTLAAQVTIVFTAVLASIGTAAVPGAGIVMLIVILEAINVPGEGIALILGVDRILDMCRTVVNVTGDSAVATIIASSENQLDPPSG